MPQPYVTAPDMARRPRHCCAGTVTKYHGAGPFQHQIVPLNSMFIALVLLFARQPGAHIRLVDGVEVVEEFAGREALVAQPHKLVFAARRTPDGLDPNIVRQIFYDSA